MPSENHQYSEDLFADTRMTFGEHLEDLRTHLWRAIKGLGFFLVIGFVLDAIGFAVGVDSIGIGKPAMNIISAPVREQLQAFFDERLKKLDQDAQEGNAR